MANPFAAGMDAFGATYGATQGILDQRNRMKAGRKLATGDRRGAAETFAGAGMIDEARQMQRDDMVMEDRSRAQQDRQRAEAVRQAEILISAAPELMKIPDPQGRRQALTHPIFQAAGLTGEVIGQLSDEDLSDQGIGMFVREMKRQLQVVNRGEGGYDVVDLGTGEAVRSVPSRVKPFEMDPEKTYVLPGDEPVATADANTDAVFEALIQQESGGRPGVLGPQTRYGRAEGMTQMLPATAEEMARKVGLPWNPSLMRGDTPRAIEYQKRLGRAYFEEGLQKYGGDVRRALMYYHGGPDERLWGPKTQAYAEQVLARLQGGEGEDRLQAPGGFRVVQQGRPKQDKPPAGFRWKADGTLEPIPGGPQDKSAKNPQAMAERAEKARRVIGTIDDALADTSAWTAGFVGGNLSGIKGTPAYNLARQVETIKANLGFEELQRMRDASPTGGALGQVAVQELVALQATVANLDTGQSPEQLRANLEQIREHYSNWLEAVGQKPPPARNASGGDDDVIQYDASGNRVR